jgi:hypothetical protein
MVQVKLVSTKHGEHVRMKVTVLDKLKDAIMSGDMKKATKNIESIYGRLEANENKAPPKLSDYQKFANKRRSVLQNQGLKATEVMSQIGKEWQTEKLKKSTGSPKK